ncbi:MgtC/SapB family protein [Oceanibacterium hippocampi]|uniref:Protein MgtC n=1 Tax=Oceanibacterium hippocampi TaxID=745714 RepID=A0A1Y5TY85_9PROT|nr:MgtC/SapB family protein [Oceanibacterium hippocampi]SLN73746.1 putative Mg(2+) transport ATPase [Oceanibacterium hippocampi]
MDFSLSEMLNLREMVIPLHEVAFRLTLALLFGMIIGLDREFRKRPAGLRTHMLVALAASVFTVITFELFHEVSEMTGSVNADPIRVIEAVTAGVAFLAAGTIVQSRGNVRGLTTGASMWLAGATGMACGGGYYAIAVLIVALTLPTLLLLGIAEHRLGKSKSDD